MTTPTTNTSHHNTHYVWQHPLQTRHITTLTTYDNTHYKHVTAQHKHAIRQDSLQTRHITRAFVVGRFCHIFCHTYEWLIHQRAPCLCCGYCATWQGSLDWVEVDLSARPASSFSVIWVLCMFVAHMTRDQMHEACRTYPWMSFDNWRLCGTTHSYDSFTYVTGLMYVWDVTHSWQLALVWHMWRANECMSRVTHTNASCQLASMWHDSSIWLLHICDVTHVCVRRDSFVTTCDCVTRKWMH